MVLFRNINCRINVKRYILFIWHLQSYKVYYTTNPNQPEQSWDSQMVDNSELTTISELTPHAIYTVRIQAFTSMGAGPMSTPVQVKTQQGLYLYYIMMYKLFYKLNLY